MFHLNSPDRWIWLLAALPIIAFFFLRTRLRRRPVATLLFWEQVFHQRPPRAWGGQLRHLSSLMLQLAFLGLLVAALLDPLGAGQKKRTRQIVLVVDRSASMQAVNDAGESRWSAALRVAQEEITAMRAGDEMALVSSGSPGRVEVGLTQYGPGIRDALASLRPTDGPAPMGSALEMARQLTTDPTRRDIVVITDGCIDADQGLDLLQAFDKRLRIVGQPAGNVAIDQFQIRRSLVDPIGYAVLIEVANHSEDPESIECQLTLELDGKLIDVHRLQLEPGQRWRKTFQDADSAGGVLKAHLDIEDALAIDNTAMAILPARRPIPVNLVSESENVFLSNALSAIPLVELTASPQPIVPHPERGITVLHRIVPSELPDGPLVFIDPQQDSPFWQLGEPIDDPVVSQQDIQSPLLAHVTLSNVSLPGAHRLERLTNHRSLLSTADGNVLMASLLDTQDDRAARRVVVLSTQLEGSDLPLRVAFPVMMTNIVNGLANGMSELQPALSTGQTDVVAVGPGIGGQAVTAEPVRWKLVGPLAEDSRGTGDRQPATANGEQSLAAVGDPSDNRVMVGPLDAAGLYVLRAESSTGNRVDETIPLAVNLANSDESSLRERSWKGYRSGPAVSVGRPVWFYLILSAMALILAEWFLYQRRLVG